MTAAWCWSTHQGAVCLVALGHDGNHAGTDFDGKWLRWTGEGESA